MTQVAPRPLGPEGLKSGAGVYLEDRRSRIAVSGKDAIGWLNGILSNDVAALAKGSGPRAGYACALTDKGKIMGDAIVVLDGRASGECGVWVPSSETAAIHANWDRYVIMEDVELTIDDGRRLVSLQGGNARDVAEAAGLGARGASFDDLGAGGLLFEVTIAEVDEVVRRLIGAGAVRLEEGDVHTLRVELGRPTFGHDFDTKNYVQEAGLESRAVSFSKGCYHGQEVVCMLEMRGHVTKKLVQVAIENGAEVRAGDDVLAGDALVGKITSVVPRSDGSAIALAMVKYAHATAGTKLVVAARRAEVLKPVS